MVCKNGLRLYLNGAKKNFSIGGDPRPPLNTPMYMQRHEGVKPCVCDECPKRFYTVADLKQHQPVQTVLLFLWQRNVQAYKRQVKQHFLKCSAVQESSFFELILYGETDWLFKPALAK